MVISAGDVGTWCGSPPFSKNDTCIVLDICMTMDSLEGFFCFAWRQGTETLYIFIICTLWAGDGNHCLLIDAPHKRPVLRRFDISSVTSVTKLLNKQPSYRWFETPWRLCDVTAMSSLSVQSNRMAIAFALQIISVIKIRTICHVRDLWKLARSCKQLRLLCSPDPWNFPGAALCRGFQSSHGALKSTE